MTPAIATAVVEAYRQTGLSSTADAEHIVRQWLKACGFQLTRHLDYRLHEGAPVRWKLKRRVLVQEEKRNGAWYSLSSRSTIDAATNLLARAGATLEDTSITAAAQGKKAAKKRGIEKRVAREEQSKVERAIRDAAIEVLHREAFPGLMEVLEKRADEATFQRVKQKLDETKASMTVEDATRVTDSFSIDAPPIMPFVTKTQVTWVETVDGVPYTIDLVGHGHGTKVAIGGAALVGVDPMSHRISMSGMGGGDTQGDGLLTGTIDWTDDGRTVGTVFFVSAKERRRGTGARLMSIYARLLRAYGGNAFVAKAVGDEGRPYLEALERRGFLRILHREGHDIFIGLEPARRENPMKSVDALREKTAHVSLIDKEQEPGEIIMDVSVYVRGHRVGYLAAVKYAGDDQAFYVRVSSAKHGWGPFVYDVAMQRATELGYGLAPDVRSVSTPARNMWNRYLSRRDVYTTPREGRLNVLWVRDTLPVDETWLPSKLVFHASPTTLADLRKRGKIFETSQRRLAAQEAVRLANPVLSFEDARLRRELKTVGPKRRAVFKVALAETFREMGYPSPASGEAGADAFDAEVVEDLVSQIYDRHRNPTPIDLATARRDTERRRATELGKGIVTPIGHVILDHGPPLKPDVVPVLAAGTAFLAAIGRVNGRW